MSKANLNVNLDNGTLPNTVISKFQLLDFVAVDMFYQNRCQSILRESKITVICLVPFIQILYIFQFSSKSVESNKWKFSRRNTGGQPELELYIIINHVQGLLSRYSKTKDDVQRKVEN